MDGSQTMHSGVRSQTIDPSVLGGGGSFLPPVDEDSREKSRSGRSRDFGLDGEPERPAALDHSSDDDFAPGKERYGPPKRRLSARKPKPSLKRKLALAAPQSDNLDVSPHPTPEVKVRSSAGVQWPKGTKMEFCHQCRHLTMRRHMHCTSGQIRHAGQACRLRFCEGCLVTRCASPFYTAFAPF